MLPRLLSPGFRVPLGNGLPISTGTGLHDSRELPCGHKLSVGQNVTLGMSFRIWFCQV